jgi:hypothetical protein
MGNGDFENPSFPFLFLVPAINCKIRFPFLLNETPVPKLFSAERGDLLL